MKYIFNLCLFILSAFCFTLTSSAVDTLAGSLTVQQWIKAQGVLAAPQITGNQNNYAPTGLGSISTLRLTSDADRNITGIVPATTTVPATPDGRLLFVYNVNSSAYTITLVNSSTSSTAANRFEIATDIVLTPNGPGTLLQYDATAHRWRCIGGAGSGGGGGGSVSSVGLELPSDLFDVGGSPVTGSGTLSGTLKTQTAHYVWAGPTTGSAAAPAFRLLVATDLPDISSTYLTVAAAALAYQPLNTKLTAIGTLTNASGWLHNNGSGTFIYSTPTKSDVGLSSVENTALSTWPGTTSITILGTIATGTWNADVITSAKIATALTGKTYNALTLTAATVGFTVAGGTTSKTLTVPLDATVSGTNTGDQDLSGYVPSTRTVNGQPLSSNVTVTTVSGNAGTATALATARTINLVSFDGSQDITVTAAAGTLTGNTLKATVLTSSLTAVGTIATGVWQGTAIADTYISSAATWNAKGTGSVTSVSLTAPSFLSVGGSPITTSGTLALTLATQAANTVFAGPSTGADAAPTFRTLVTADVPTLNQNTTGSAAKWTTARNLAGNSVDGTAAVAFANKFIVQGTTDTGLSAAQFLGALGTGILKNTTTTGVLSIAIAADFPTLNQNTTGSAATLTTPRAINGTNFDGSAAITVTAAAGTLTGTTLNSTVVTSSLTSVGIIATGTWSATTIAANKGGTGLASYTVGDLLYASTTSALSARAAVATGQVLISQGTSTAPIWSASPTLTGLLTSSANGEGLAVAPTTGTSAGYMRFQNTGGAGYVGMDSSTGSAFSFGNYSFNIYAPTDLVLSRAGSERLRATSTGISVTGSITSTGSISILSATTNSILFKNSGGTTIQEIKYDDSDGSLTLGGGGGNFPVRIRQNSTTIATISSAGLAVTGTLSATGVITSTATTNLFNSAAATTGTAYFRLQNTGGINYFGLDDSTGASFGSSAYALFMYSAANIEFLPGGTKRGTFSSTGLAVVGAVSTTTKVLAGTSSTLAGGAAETLHVLATTFSAVDYGVIVAGNAATNPVNALRFYSTSNSAVVGSVSFTTVATLYNTTSDVRLKTNIRNLPNSGKIIDALRPVLFDWKKADSPDTYGFIAQEVYKVFPQAVSKGDDGKTITQQWAMDAGRFMPVVISELQSLRARVSKLEQRN